MLKKPKQARGVMGVNPWARLEAISRELFWGNPEGDPARKAPTIYRGAVVVGCVLRQKPGLDGGTRT